MKTRTGGGEQREGTDEGKKKVRMMVRRDDGEKIKDGENRQIRGSWNEEVK
jgi:hypothetical protein